MYVKERFPLIDMSGNPEEIGTQHGKLLKNRINQTIEFYNDVTKKLDEDGRESNRKYILNSARNFKNIIHFLIHYFVLSTTHDLEPWRFLIGDTK